MWPAAGGSDHGTSCLQASAIGLGYAVARCVKDWSFTELDRAGGIEVDVAGTVARHTRWARRKCENWWLRASSFWDDLSIVELSIRGILRGFGLKIGLVTRNGFEARLRELVTGQATLEHIARAMLSARAVLRVEYEKLHKAVLALVREDAVCRRLMTVPGVGPLVAMTYKSAIDDPSRITKSKAETRDAGRLNTSLLPEVPSPGRWMR